MANLEDQDVWAKILQLKDSLSLRDLSARFGTTPGAISAAFKRTGTSRAIAAGGGDDLPPEPGEDGDDDEEARPGSKDALLAQHLEQLGQVPDAEIAALAGVSVRTVASFRARHGISGYRGPRRPADTRAPRRSRIDPFVGLLGKVADRIVAEKAGVSLNAVRNYRVKRGIRASGRPATEAVAAVAPVVLPTGDRRLAWRVTWRRAAGEETSAVLLATDLVDAARQAGHVKVPGEVVALALAGPLLD